MEFAATTQVPAEPEILQANESTDSIPPVTTPAESEAPTANESADSIPPVTAPAEPEILQANESADSIPPVTTPAESLTTLRNSGKVGLIGDLSDEELTACAKTYYQQSLGLFTRYVRTKRDLAEALYEAHSRLARPGCKGRWQGFVDEVGISKSSAEQLINAYLIVLMTAPQLRVAAEEAGIDLYRCGISEELKSINAELAGSTPTVDEFERLLDRLDRVRVRLSRKGIGGRKAVVDQVINVASVSRPEAVEHEPEADEVEPDDVEHEPEAPESPSEPPVSQPAPEPELGAEASDILARTRQLLVDAEMGIPAPQTEIYSVTYALAKHLEARRAMNTEDAGIILYRYAQPRAAAQAA